MAIAAAIKASQVSAAASAAVPAQVIEEKRLRERRHARRNLSAPKQTGLACARNQSWIWVADAEAMMMPTAA